MLLNGGFPSANCAWQRQGACSTSGSGPTAASRAVPLRCHLARDRRALRRLLRSGRGSRRPSALLPVLALHADYQAKAGDSSVLQRPLKSELQSSELRDVFGFPRNLRERYSLGAVLGAGSFGVVREATDRVTGRRYAVKSIPKTPKSGRATPRYLLKLQTEVDAMGQLGASLDAVCLQDVFEDDASVHLVMELCAGGSVLDRLKDGEYSERQVAHVMRAVLRFLSQCHSKGIVYRDVKPENFMLLYKDAAKQGGAKPPGGQGEGAATTATLWQNLSRAVGLSGGSSVPAAQAQQGGQDDTLSSPVKATDFGLSIRHTKGDPPLKSRSGTPAYMAPEVITQSYNSGADVWSAGIMMYQLLTGKFPFWTNVRECTLQQVWKSILSDRIDFSAPELRQVTPAARDLLRQMLHRDPAVRISASSALRHPWLRSDEAASALPLRSSVVQRLQRFATYGHLKQLVLRIIADELNWHPSEVLESREKLDSVRGLFYELDVDASGSVSMDELLAGLERLGYDLSASELEQLMRRVDINQDGSLQLSEFVAGLADWGELQADGQWGRWVSLAFDRLDSNKDGFLSLSSLEDMLVGARFEGGSGSDGDVEVTVLPEDGTGMSGDEALTTEAMQETDRVLEARRMLREADANGDGHISREEFAELLSAGTVPDGLGQYDPRLKGMPADLASVDEEMGTLDTQAQVPRNKG